MKKFQILITALLLAIVSTAQAQPKTIYSKYLGDFVMSGSSLFSTGGESATIEGILVELINIGTGPSDNILAIPTLNLGLPIPDVSMSNVRIAEIDNGHRLTADRIRVPIPPITIPEGIPVLEGITIDNIDVTLQNATIIDGVLSFRIAASVTVLLIFTVDLITIDFTGDAIYEPPHWNTNVPPDVRDGEIVIIETGAADTLKIPANATITIINEEAVDNASNRIILDIAPTSKVIWEVEYSAGVSGSNTGAVAVIGGGLLEVQGTIININTASNTAGVFLTNGDITVSQSGVVHCPNVPATGSSFARGITIPHTNRFANIIIDGGLVRTTGAEPAINAISSSGTDGINQTSVTVKNGGIVISTHQRAIRAQTVTIEDGFVFGAPQLSGTATPSVADAIGSSETADVAPPTLNISGNSVIIFWNRGSATGQRTFTQYTSDRLHSFHGDAKVWWDIQDELFGVANDKNDIFVHVPQAMVEEPSTTNIRGIETTSSVQAWIANDVLNIHGLPIGQLYQIYSILGKLVHQNTAMSDIVTVNKSLPSGTYIIRSGTQFTKVVW